MATKPRGKTEEAIKAHLKKQPLHCECEECGRLIILDIIIDDDLNLHITVPVCDCTETEQF